jgi:hypothetical protein
VAVAVATAPLVVQQVAQTDQREESTEAVVEHQLLAVLVAFRETVFLDWLVRNTPVETVAMKVAAEAEAGGAAAVVATTAVVAAVQVTEVFSQMEALPQEAEQRQGCSLPSILQRRSSLVQH